MPLIELTLPDEAGPRAALSDLAEDLTVLFLEAQGVRADNLSARAITRLEARLLPPEASFVGGRQVMAPVARATFWPPAGALSEDARATLVARTTDCVARACGAEPMQVWCMVHEVALRGYAAGGRTWSWHEIKRHVARGEIARRRRAAE